MLRPARSILGGTPSLIPLFKYVTLSSDTTIKYAKISIKNTSGIGSPVGDYFNVVALTSARVTYFRILNSVHSNFNKRLVLEALIPQGNNSADERKIVYDDGSAVYVPFTMGISIAGLYGNNATITIVDSPSGNALGTENYKVIQ